MMMTSKIRELAFQGASTQEIRKAAIKGGMTTLYDDGIRKVLEGHYDDRRGLPGRQKERTKPARFGQLGADRGSLNYDGSRATAPVDSAACAVSSRPRSRVFELVRRRLVEHSCVQTAQFHAEKLESTA